MSEEMTREQAKGNLIHAIRWNDMPKKEALEMAIKALEQEPKTGHWVAVENEEMKTVGYYCSECDLPMETEQWTDFCPNCGAKMESEGQA